MKRFLLLLSVIDAASMFGGLLWLLLNGSLPSSVTQFWNETQTAMLVILCILAIPIIWLVALIVQSQRWPTIQ